MYRHFFNQSILRLLLNESNKNKLINLNECFTKRHLSLASEISKLNMDDESKLTKPENWESAKPYESIPGPKPLPLIGNSLVFVVTRDFVKLGQKLRKKYGDIVNLSKISGFGDIIFLFNAKDIEWMLRNEGQYPMRIVLPSSKFYRHEMRKETFGQTYGLLNGQNEDWGTFRTAVNPIMMQPRVTTQYIPALNEIADEFLVHVRKYKESNADGEMPADFLHELNKWAFESIVSIALDTRLGCLGLSPTDKSQKAIKYTQKVMELSLHLDLNPLGAIYKKFQTKTWRDYVKYQDFFTELALQLIDDLDQRMQREPPKLEHEKSVFEKLVAKDKKIAIVMILDMLAAGIETTGKATAAALYYLAKNKPAQEWLRKELIKLLPSKDTRVDKNILEDAKYLKATIKETLRLAPIAHSTVRVTKQPIVIGGYQIPAYKHVMMPHIYLSTGTDEHFKNPLEFKPERYLRGACQENVNAFVNLPFGFGPRSCIGKRMAQMEVEILVAKFVRNFYLDWTHADMRFKQELAYGIADPLKIRLTDVQN